MKEADMAAVVMEWLESVGWDCYPEAQFCTASVRADIAAVQGSRLWILEAKSNATLALLNQATKWIGIGHMVSVIVPYGRMNLAFLRYCQMSGIGVIRVKEAREHQWGANKGQMKDGDITIEVPPRLNRKAHSEARRFMQALHPDMKRYRPGTTSMEGYSTPWSRTMQACRDYVAENPGASLKELVKVVDHHYANDKSAMSSLRHWLEQDEAIVARLQNRPRMMLYYPAA